MGKWSGGWVEVLDKGSRGGPIERPGSECAKEHRMALGSKRPGTKPANALDNEPDAQPDVHADGGKEGRPLKVEGEKASVEIAERGRVLAVDLGERRIGLALSDPLWITAQGLPTAERRNKRENLNYLKSLVRKHGVSVVLIGNPLNMDGSAGPGSAVAADFAASLRKHLEVPGLEVHLWDERLTSVEANRVLGEAGLHHGERSRSVDQLAAVLLLENFLETQRMPGGAPSWQYGQDRPEGGPSFREQNGGRPGRRYARRQKDSAGEC